MAELQLVSGPYGLAFIGLVFVVIAKFILFDRKRSALPLPPGPPGEPILGHLRIIPSISPEYTYMQWSKDFKSDIVSGKVLGQPVIVLNSTQAAIDLLDKRGVNYCDRPRFVLFEVMGWKKTLTFLRSGPDFRMHRRILQKNFQKSNIVQYRPIQLKETIVMLNGILEHPDDWENIIRRFATAVVLGIGFGIDVDSSNDPFIQVAADASYALGHGGAPAGTPVDFFPLLRYMPRWLHDRSLKFANDWRWAIQNLHNKPFEAVMNSEDRTHSLMSAMLDQRQEQVENGATETLTYDDIKGAAGAVFAAGQDTTWATLMVFVLNMLLHPDVQRKAQQALDEVVGRERLPSFEDRPKLDLMEYILQETLRWCPVSPIGVPHRSLQDDVYNGYSIPAGSFVYANARAMTHDESVYENPDEFEPDRYIPPDKGGRGEPFPIGQFGFGRRLCVGRHLAEASVWIVMASILSTMTIVPALDDDGNEIVPKVELTYGLTSHPKRFACKFVPRDDQSASLIRRAQQ